MRLLHALRCHQIAARGNGWVRACCPLARWNHQSGHDGNPSFAIFAKAGDRPTYKCYTCGTGTVVQLIAQMELWTRGEDHGYDFKAAHDLLEEGGLEAPQLLDIAAPDPVFEEWPQYWLDSFPLARFVEAPFTYLAARNITEQQMAMHQLRYDNKRSMVVFPYWNVAGKLAGARGRSILPGTSGIDKHYDYRCNGRNNAGLVWYNEHALNLAGPVVIVEGQFDCMRVEAVWPKTVANLTAQPRAAKMAKIRNAADTVVLIPDNDITGEISVNEYARYAKLLGFKLRTIFLPDGVKDPDLCHPDYLGDRIHEALQIGTA